MIPAPGEHGGDGDRVAAALGLAPADVLDLSLSLNPAAPDPVRVVARHTEAARHYPDPGAATEALAAAIGVDPRRVVLTNGGAEAIALVAAELGPGWVDDPDFSLYRRHLPAVRPGAPRWRSDPHNPTGRLASPAGTAEVWDEAFYPLATGHWTSGRADHGAIVLGSLTKVFACPGLRLGFVLAPDAAFAARVRARQPQWSVNSLALAALPDLLATADLPYWQREVARLRRGLVEALARYGLKAEPSDANYVLVPGAGGVRDQLAAHGVVVRDCASFGLAGTVRVAVPDDRGLERLVAALAAVRPQHRPGPIVTGVAAEGGASAALGWVTTATERLLATLTPAAAELGAPSLLPGWTRAHVATHVARNADSFTWLLDGAACGERREQYPGGPTTRAAAIEAGAARPGDEVVADVERSARRLAAACSRVAPDVWSRLVTLLAGDLPAAQLVWGRLREVEVHHADLGLAFTPSDWLPAFVEHELPVRVDALGGRLPRGTALRLARTDTATTWEIGGGPASVAVSGPGAPILAWLFGRPAAGLDAPAGLPALSAW